VTLNRDELSTTLYTLVACFTGVLVSIMSFSVKGSPATVTDSAAPSLPSSEAPEPHRSDGMSYASVRSRWS
jgi:hypothetical protein